MYMSSVSSGIGSPSIFSAARMRAAADGSAARRPQAARSTMRAPHAAGRSGSHPAISSTRAPVYASARAHTTTATTKNILFMQAV